jgi:hypothetical protein
MTKRSSSQQQWCGFRGPELCSGGPLRMGGLLLMHHVAHCGGRPHSHARTSSADRKGGVPITVAASVTL